MSLTTQTPIRTPLECFLDSASIRRKDNQSWASQSVLHLAFLLDRAFSKARDPPALAKSEA
jgi:hypothetical protein